MGFMPWDYFRPNGGRISLPSAPQTVGQTGVDTAPTQTPVDMDAQTPVTMPFPKWDSMFPMMGGYIPMDKYNTPFGGNAKNLPPKSAPSPDYLPGQSQQLAPWPSIAGKSNVNTAPTQYQPLTQPQTQTGPTVNTSPSEWISRGGVTGNMSGTSQLDNQTPGQATIPGMNNSTTVNNPGGSRPLGSSFSKNRLFY